LKTKPAGQRRRQPASATRHTTDETTAICFCPVLVPEYWILVDYTCALPEVSSVSYVSHLFFPPLSLSSTDRLGLVWVYFFFGGSFTAHSYCVSSAWRSRLYYTSSLYLRSRFAGPFRPCMPRIKIARYISRMDGASTTYRHTIISYHTTVLQYHFQQTAHSVHVQSLFLHSRARRLCRLSSPSVAFSPSPITAGAVPSNPVHNGQHNTPHLATTTHSTPHPHTSPACTACTARTHARTHARTLQRGALGSTTNRRSAALHTT
jgi:hypothetical protein